MAFHIVLTLRSSLALRCPLAADDVKHRGLQSLSAYPDPFSIGMFIIYAAHLLMPITTSRLWFILVFDVMDELGLWPATFPQWSFDRVKLYSMLHQHEDRVAML